MSNVDDLVATIEAADRAYYNENNPMMSDEQYDALVRQLRDIEPTHPLLTRIAPASASGATSVLHMHPMQSLAKAYGDREFAAWFTKAQASGYDHLVAASHGYVLSPKIDGLALSLRYDHRGNLMTASTRGDGKMGEDVTAQVMACVLAGTMQVPLAVVVPSNCLQFEVRGEVYIRWSDFNQMFAEQFAHPRNLAAGSLKGQPDVAATRCLRFMAYDCIVTEQTMAASLVHRFDSYVHMMTSLMSMGFETVPFEYIGAGTNPDDFSDSANQAMLRVIMERLYDVYDTTIPDTQNTFDFPRDGAVIRVNSVTLARRMGSTEHHPGHSIAMKFGTELANTVLEDVIWQVSRNGTFTPVAIFHPVWTEGAEIQRATLHNVTIIEELAGGQRLFIGRNENYPFSKGATITVSRRGGVIPAVEALVSPGWDALVVPDVCTSCGRSTYFNDEAGSGRISLSTTHSPSCAHVQAKRMRHFLSTVNILSIGEALIDSMAEADLLPHGLLSLFTLTEQELRSLPKVGKTKATSILRALDTSASPIPWTIALAGLGIDNVGTTLSTVLATYFPTYYTLVDADDVSLASVPGLGPKTVQALRNENEFIRTMFDGLISCGVNIDLNSPKRPVDYGQDTRLPLSGKNVLVSGKHPVSQFTVEDTVRKLGGTVQQAYNKHTHIIIAPDGYQSTKTKAAETRGKGSFERLSWTDFISRYSI